MSDQVSFIYFKTYLNKIWTWNYFRYFLFES